MIKFVLCNLYFSKISLFGRSVSIVSSFFTSSFSSSIELFTFILTKVYNFFYPIETAFACIEIPTSPTCNDRADQKNTNPRLVTLKLSKTCFVWSDPRLSLSSPPFLIHFWKVMMQALHKNGLRFFAVGRKDWTLTCPILLYSFDQPYLLLYSFFAVGRTDIGPK